MLFNSIGRTPTTQESSSYAERTKLYRKNSFQNQREIPFLLPGERSKKAAERIPKTTVPIIRQTDIPQAAEGELKFCWLGHSSILLQMGTVNILIDPILTNNASPVSRIGVRRYSEVPIRPEELPYIDVVLLSHDHYDHLDYETICAIRDKVGHFVVPLGVECILQGWKIDAERITALAWWESVTLCGVTITATPSQHFAGRNPFRRNATWWCGFCMEDQNHTVYYTGDGGYSDTFAEIGRRFHIDLVFLECGQYDAAWPACHMFPEEGAQAAAQLAADWCVPVHWGAFCLCNTTWNDSVRRIVREAEKLQVRIATPRIGEYVEYGEISEKTEHWWE